MVTVKRYKNKIEEFLSGEKGQRFFNFAYSIGAAIVIWGALFKILHLPGGNLLLAIGMGTEVLMFILTAFDRPRHYDAPQQYYVSEQRYSSFQDSLIATNNDQVPSKRRIESAVADNSISPSHISVGAELTQNYTSELENVIKEMRKMKETTNALNTLYEMQLKSVSSQLSAFEHSGGNIAAMREMMEKSAQQSKKYCEETEKMAQNMATLNSIYAAMITAMSKNSSK